MLNNRVIAIIKRELREKLMSKAFIFMTLMVPLFMFGIMGFQALMVMYQGDRGTRIELVTESEPLTESLQDYLSKQEFVTDGTYIITFSTLFGQSIKEYVEDKKPDILAKKISGIIFIPSAALSNKKLEYYSETPNNISIFEKLDNHINEVLIEQYFLERDLSEDDLRFARETVRFSGFKVSEKEDLKEEGYGNIILAFVFAFLIYFSLIFSAQMTMNSVLEEKSSKVVEVTLSSVTSREFMTGKIIGCTVTSFAQMVIWLLPFIILVTTTWITLPEWMVIDISYFHLIYFLFNFLMACLIFQGLAATVGSIFDNTQEAQSGFFPVMLLIMVPFFLCFSLLRNPNNPIAVIASYLPFSTIMVMPCRFTIVDLPLWKLLLSQLVNIATLIAIFPLAGKIYKIGILRSGTKPTLREVLKWLRA